MGKKIRRRLIAGNCKMNGDILSLEDIRKMVKLDFSDDFDVVGEADWIFDAVV